MYIRVSLDAYFYLYLRTYGFDCHPDTLHVRNTFTSMGNIPLVFHCVWGVDVQGLKAQVCTEEQVVSKPQGDSHTSTSYPVPV